MGGESEGIKTGGGGEQEAQLRAFTWVQSQTRGGEELSQVYGMITQTNPETWVRDVLGCKANISW